MVSIQRATQLGCYFWSHNAIDVANNTPRRERANPLFTYSFGAGYKFALPRSSIPHKGFHLSISHPSVNLTSDSPYRNCIEIPEDGPYSAMQVETTELEGWIRAFRAFAYRSSSSGTPLQIRVFVGDPCAFSFALQQRQTKSVSNALKAYIQPWKGTLLNLDGQCYIKEGKFSAPLRYNVIDASNVIDKVGLLNLLVSVIPLVEESPSATITTDTTYYSGLQGREHELLTELLGGNVGDICSLLGVAPLSYITGIATGDQHESPPVDTYGFTERIVWKLTLFGDPAATPENARPMASPEDLANFLFGVYRNMPHYDISNWMERILEHRRKTKILKFHPPRTTRRGFAALLAFLKRRLSVDWEALMSTLVRKIEASEADLPQDMGYMNRRDLYLDLHLLGVYTVNDMRQELGRTPFGAMTCVIGTLHRDLLNFSEPRFKSMKNMFLAFQLQFLIYGTADRPEVHDIFSSTTPIFGKLLPADYNDYKFEVDPKGWEGDSDLHICAYVPTHVLFRPNGKLRDIQVMVGMMPEFTTVAAFDGTEIGDVLAGTLMRAKITDKSHVRLLKTFPGLTVPSPSIVPSSHDRIAFQNTSIEISYPLIDFKNSAFTTRITIKHPDLNRELLDVTLKGTSPCTADLTLAKTSYRCTFPFSISDKVNLRRSKKSGWIEVITKMSSPAETGGYYTSPFPVLSDGQTVINWNFSSIHFGQVPKLKFSGSTVPKWVELNLRNMYSDAEITNLASVPGTCAGITEYKKSIDSIFKHLVSSNGRVFEIRTSSDAGPSLVLLVTGVFLDDVGRTILAEAYAIVSPLSHRSDQSALERECRNSVKLILGNEGTALWKSSLPAMIERCRDFEHKSGCKFESHSNSSVGNQIAMVACGCQTIGIELFGFKELSLVKYATRIAIAPVYAPRFVVASRKLYYQHVTQHLEKASQFPKPPKLLCDFPECQNHGTMKCGRCEFARYCSKKCQRAHWKQHKVECQSRNPSGQDHDQSLSDSLSELNVSSEGSRDATRIVYRLSLAELLENKAKET